MWTVKGKTFTKKRDLANYVHCSETYISSLIKAHTGNEESLIVILEGFRDDFEFKSRIADKLSNYLNIPIPYNGLSTKKLDNTILYTDIKSAGGTYQYLRVLEYALDKEYMWMFDKRLSNFEFKGVTFPNMGSFYNYFKIIKSSLFEEIIRQEGDLWKAVLNTRDDPEYKARHEYNINGVTYHSAIDVARAFNISAPSYKVHYRRTNDAEEALRLSLESKEFYTSKLEGLFPIRVLDQEFHTVSEISRLLDLSTPALNNYILEGEDNLSVVVNALRDKKLTGTFTPFLSRQHNKPRERVIDNIPVKTLSDLRINFGLDKHVINTMSTVLNLTAQEYLDTLEKYKVTYDGLNFYCLNSLSKHLDIYPRTLSNSYSEYICSDLSKDAHDTLVRSIDRLMTILSIGGNHYKGLKDLCIDLGFEFKKAWLGYQLRGERLTPLEIKKELLTFAKEFGSREELINGLQQDIKLLQTSLPEPIKVEVTQPSPNNSISTDFRKRD